jgi:hypothetical protein
MIQLLREKFPQHAALLQGWSTPPTDPSAPDDALPGGAQTPFDPDKKRAIQTLQDPFAGLASDDDLGRYIETMARPVPGDPYATSQDRATGIHNYLHNRFSDESSPVDMGQPLRNLGNARFWRLHGWIDGRWSAFRKAKGLSDTDKAYVADLDAQKMHLGGHMMGLEAAVLTLSEADIPETIRHPFRESIAGRFSRLMSTTPQPSTVEELQSYLQLAIKLEHFTLPLYLTAMWSLKPGPATRPHIAIIRNIAMQEMLHLGLVSNILVAIGGVPQILDPVMLPSYPSELPGIDNPKPFRLEAFSKTQIERFLEIEYPEAGAIPSALEAVVLPEVKFKTIGDFYDAVDRGLVALDQQGKLPPFVLKGQRGLDIQKPGDLFVMKTVDDARRAIRTIKEQGEGTSQSQGAIDIDGALAHYYAFEQFILKKKYAKQPDGTYKPDPTQPLPIPTADQIFPMAPIPAGGYPNHPPAVAFDQTYSAMLGKLQDAWEKDDSSALDGAIESMSKLSVMARSLMSTPITPGGTATYGPTFIYRPPPPPPPPAAEAGLESMVVPAPAPPATIPGYARIKQILDDAVQNSNIGGHGPFWRTLTRDQFVAKAVFGKKLIAKKPDGTFDPDESNLVKALEGRPPFGANLTPPPAGAIFNRMPDGFPAVPTDRVAEIRAWISAGCPEKPISTTPLTEAAAGGPVDPQVHIAFWRDFDDWAMFHATSDVGDDINSYFGATDAWFAYAKDPLKEPDWVAALADPSVRQAISRLEAHQRLTVSQHYGRPAPLLTLLDSFETFGNDSLPDDLARPQDVRHRMNGAIMWFMWSAFADACLRLAPEITTIPAADWQALSRAILLGLLNDGVFRKRYTVTGDFTADDAGKQAMRNYVQAVPADGLLAELAKRCKESGLAAG